MQEVANYASAVVALGTRDRLDLIYLELARSKHGAMLRLMPRARACRSPPPRWAAR